MRMVIFSDINLNTVEVTSDKLLLIFIKLLFYGVFDIFCTFVNVLLYKVQFISFVYLMRIKMHDIVRYTV